MPPPHVTPAPTALPGVALVLALTFPSAAFAQQPDLDARVRQGMALREQNQPDAAMEHFRRLWESSHYPRALAQLAVTEQTLGRWAEADRHFREVLALTDHVWVQQNRALVQESLATIAEHIGELEVLGAPPGAELWVNDQRVAVTPLAAPLRLAIGTAVIELRATGFVPWRRTVTLAPRQLTRETAVMVRAGETSREAIVATPSTTTTTPVTTPPPPPVVAMRDPGATQRVLGWVSVGLAAVGAGVGVGGYFLLQDASSLNANLRSMCSDPISVGCGQWGDSLGNAGVLLGAGFGAAGAFLATGLTLLLTAPSREPAPRASVVCLPSLGGVGCALRF